MTLASVLVCSIAGAQNVQPRSTLMVQREDAPSGGARPAGLDKKISLAVDGVSISDALEHITRLTGVAFDYTADIFVTTRRVSLSAQKEAARAVLIRLLAGTGVAVGPEAEGHVALVRDKGARQTAAGVVNGRVVNAKTKQPIAGATILLDNAAKGVLTSDDGTFRIGAAAGSHTVSVRAIGFVRQSKSVVVTDGQSASVEFQLDASASVLDEVVVTGTVVATERKAIPTPITVIKGDELEKRGITRLEQLFRGEVPGVMAFDRGSNAYSSNGGVELLGNMQRANVYVRGSSSLNGAANPLKTYVDGVELFDPSYLGTIDPKNIERIEIITGPQAATIYGSGAMGGVMQIFTKRGNGSGRAEFTLNLRYGMLQSNGSDGRTPVHNHALTMQGGSGPEFSYSGTVSHDYTGQWIPGLFNRTSGAQAGATHVRGPLTINGTAAFTIGRNGTYLNTPYVIQQVQSGEWRFAQIGYGTQQSNRESTSSSQTLALNLDFRATRWWQHHITFGRNQTDFEMVPVAPMYRYAAFDTLYSGKSSTGRRLSMSYNTTVVANAPVAGIRPTLTLGATGTDGSSTSFEGDATSANATTWVNTAIYRPLDDKSYGGFGSVQLNVSDKLFFTFGLRGEHSGNYGAGHQIDWTPTNGVTYTIERGDLTLKLLASYGRATRSPQPGQRDEVYWINEYYDPSSYIQYFAAPNLRPEYERGPQGGFELYYGNVGSLTVNHYQENVTDLIMRVTVDSIYGAAFQTPQYLYQYQYQNVARIGKRGWEGTGSLRFGAFTVKGTYSWNDSKIISLLNGMQSYGGYSIGQSYYLTPTHIGSATLSYALGGTSVSLAGNWVGASLMARNNNSLLVYTPTAARIKTYLQRVNIYQAMFSRPGYLKSDLSASQRLTPWASFTLNVNNLGNSYGSETSFFDPTIGRQTTFGLSLRSR